MPHVQRSTAPALLASTLAITLLLTGCGGSDDTGAAPTTGTASSSASDSASPSSNGTPASGPHNIGDVTFATGMIPHHAQAVEMTDVLLAKEDIDPAVLALAEQIKTAQAPEIEQMSGWLTGWREPVPTNDDMGGIEGMDHSGGGMSEQDMSALEDASGADAARLFLEQMIGHHGTAIPMARTELREGQNPDAKELAQRIIETQESEIITMTELLAG